jgi:hypothetical protein
VEAFRHAIVGRGDNVKKAVVMPGGHRGFLSQPVELEALEASPAIRGSLDVELLNLCIGGGSSDGDIFIADALKYPTARNAGAVR